MKQRQMLLRKAPHPKVPLLPARGVLSHPTMRNPHPCPSSWPCRRVPTAACLVQSRSKIHACRVQKALSPTAQRCQPSAHLRGFLEKPVHGAMVLRCPPFVVQRMVSLQAVNGVYILCRPYTCCPSHPFVQRMQIVLWLRAATTPCC
jgi:hypothetical protein